MKFTERTDDITKWWKTCLAHVRPEVQSSDPGEEKEEKKKQFKLAKKDEFQMFLSQKRINV